MQEGERKFLLPKDHADQGWSAFAIVDYSQHRMQGHDFPEFTGSDAVWRTPGKFDSSVVLDFKALRTFERMVFGLTGDEREAPLKGEIARAVIGTKDPVRQPTRWIPVATFELPDKALLAKKKTEWHSVKLEGRGSIATRFFRITLFACGVPFKVVTWIRADEYAPEDSVEEEHGPRFVPTLS